MRRRSLSVPNLMAIDKSFTSSLPSMAEEGSVSPSSNDWMNVLGFDPSEPPTPTGASTPQSLFQQLEAQANPRAPQPGSNDILQVLDLGVGAPMPGGGPPHLHPAAGGVATAGGFMPPPGAHPNAGDFYGGGGMGGRPRPPNMRMPTNIMEEGGLPLSMQQRLRISDQM